MIAPRVLLLLSLTFVSIQAIFDKTKCNCCKVVVEDVKNLLPSYTGSLRERVEEAVKVGSMCVCASRLPYYVTFFFSSSSP
ncbi:hypothetical protein GCK32_021213 [Trichostrongylus colubriformis]|uniref:Saposin B-type domain-containing protein n=1 Tax=Trichostrongylus colubriformis TaxID=6319 RepID=A0AAN8F1U4_TRICO